MALHSLLCVLLLLTEIWAKLFKSMIAYKINNFTNSVVYLLMACILDKMNSRPKLEIQVVAINNPPKTKSSSLHMSGEFAEIDLASDMHNLIIPKIIDESGEEPKMSKTFTLFTDTNSNGSNSMCDEDNNNILLNTSDMEK
jgi:hypothetical protein